MLNVAQALCKPSRFLQMNAHFRDNLLSFVTCKSKQLLVRRFSRDFISKTKPRKKFMRTSLVEYEDILILIGNFP